ncbi:class I tRNA ligase family protein [Streptomyces chitinivorans]|uniref:Class I tRNA ligase family protein n=1 Tax=Streptomyces chitinivorans TaxID=1257027 RepID=A0ABW7HY82_9ACTN|nr:class I tRNA ligase family protein [Streptomyces chitinivorans]MDH2410422.1 class I tRNA ligase family protein [Streptomyces chitinivorans]
MTDAPRGTEPGRRRINVTFSPPTPNGDLHLGHLSGPVLGSDVCARAQKIHGHDVAFGTSTDDNQTYVVTTAERLGTDPESLIRHAFDSVTKTLELAGVDVDLFERPDSDYTAFVKDFFTGLWRHGAFDRREVDLPYDAASDTYKAEAFVTGRCPTCLAHARAGVCEACGLYNLPGALLSVAGSASALPTRRVPIWVLDLERHRTMLTDWYRSSDVRLRPDLDHVVAQSLAGPLPYIPVTYPGTWGITVDWDAPNDLPQAINAWPEIYVGHVYWLRRAREGRQAGCDELVQFIGIDNGFYNAFVYVALSLLAARHGLPVDLPRTRTLTNQYYLLEGRKFSTSKGDVRWAGEFLESVGRDRTRFVLSLTSPELQQSEFSEPVAAFTLATRFDAPLKTVAETLTATAAGRRVDAEPSTWWRTALAASRRRFEDAYRLETFSIRKAAEALALHLEVLALRCADLDADDPGDICGALQFLWTLRTLAWPLTPDLCEQVSNAFGAPSTVGAPPLLAELDHRPPGAFTGLAADRIPSSGARDGAPAA